MSNNQSLWKIKFTCKKIHNFHKFLNIVKNGKFGKAKDYLKKNLKSHIKLSFKLIEKGTKKVKKEVKTSPFLLQDTIIFLNNEIIEMYLIFF